MDISRFVVSFEPKIPYEEMKTLLDSANNTSQILYIGHAAFI